MSVPAGYEQATVGSAHVVARKAQLEAVCSTLATGTLFDYAARHAEARGLAGRGIAYAAPLPDGERVVVRHNRHGGLLAPITGDRFLAPTRAPRELAAALRLTADGVPTPEIIAYVVYKAGPLLRRSDVASREVPDSADLGVVLTTGTLPEQRAALAAATSLIAHLSACGARHHDLNVKNVLLAPRGSTSPTAYVLDVDRVEFGRPGDSRVTEGNLERFMRSARKWRALHGARVDESELARIAASVRRFVASRSPRGAPESTRS
ncbi:MAG TPA: lipopolysaccharide kinase InaA family protein [Gemmatimonadaceae bacterium]|nr:lipopolysaccharide kinase InaA family protein [Gemmatimonadaceae bacterium]